MQQQAEGSEVRGVGSSVLEGSSPVDIQRLGSASPPSANGVSASHWRDRIVTSALVLLPVLGLAWAIVRFWHHGISLFDVLLAIAFFEITGHGVSIGFHRLFTHNSFRTHRLLRIALAIAGSMAIEGSVTSWVSHHRRHHVYADLPGDPHSPFHYGTGFIPQLRGLLHAHVAWLYSGMTSDPQRWSRDLLADRDIVRVSSLTPLWMTMSLALPFGIGWAFTRTLTGALLALLWAGAVRIAVLQHVTWSVNSLGHMFGKHPFKTRDESRNLAILAFLSFGDGWHNAHHAFPALARHGVDRGQLDSSAMIIRVFELLGWAWRVRWPTTVQLATRRIS